MKHWTLRARMRAIFSIAAVLAVLALTVGVVSFVRVLDARHELVDRIDPAAVAERDGLAAFLNLETGVRGFTLTGDDRFLQPYVDGTASAADAAGRLQSLLAASPRLTATFDEAVRQATVWRNEFAEPEIARVRTFGAGEPSTEVLDRGREQLDAVRTTLRDLENQLAQMRNDARHDLTRATQLLIGSLCALLLVALALGASAWFGFSRWTLGPLNRLGAGTRRVTAGELGYELQPEGPPEIANLGTDVEAMRQRILDEVAAVEAARVELEQQALDLARSNTDLEHFAYVASHDLQEPLRKVTGFCQLLQRRYHGQFDERADQYIEFAVDGARRMQTLINDLLTFSRVGRSMDAFVDVDTRDVADKAALDLETPITLSGALLEVGELPTVQGDPTLLLMLFRNLIGNAIKFRGEDAPVVRISARRDGDDWQFAFADNGISIEPEYAEKVFLIFQRLHSREQYEGTGIGLALARKITEFHGGRIWIDAAARPGTTIRFTIPVSKSNP
jgi:signal transduction histidine kinase